LRYSEGCKKIKKGLKDNQFIYFIKIYKMPNNKRSFTIEYDNQRFGRLMSGTPRQAAQKAVNCIARRFKAGELGKNYKKNDWNKFKIIETTRGSNKKSFGYRGIRKKREKPVEALIAGKKIICKFDTQVYSTRSKTLTQTAKSGGASKKSHKGIKKNIKDRKNPKKGSNKGSKKGPNKGSKKGSK
jgi:hypothetical protein